MKLGQSFQTFHFYVAAKQNSFSTHACNLHCSSSWNVNFIHQIHDRNIHL